MAKKFYTSFITVTAFSILTRLISFIFHIFLSRELGAENIGIFQITCSILFMFISLSSSGFPVTLSRKIAYYDAIGEYSRGESMLTSTLIITGTLSGAICLFFTLFPSSLKLLFSNPACITPFLLLLPALFAGSLYSSIRAWFWGKKRYTLYSAVELIDEIMLIAVMTTLISLGIFGDKGYNALALGHSIADILCAVVLIIIFGIFGGRLSKPRHFRELTAASAPITTTRIISSIVSSTVALLLPSLLVRAGLDMSFATAQYGRMSGMVMPIILSPGTIVSSLIVVMIPDLSGTVSKCGIDAITDKVKNSIMFSTAVSGLFMTVFIACGQDIAQLLYNDALAGEMITYCAFLTVPLVLNQLTSSIINTLGKESWTFTTSMISSAGLVLTIILASKSMHIYAYPLGLGVYHTIGFFINTYELIKSTHIGKKYLINIAFLYALSVLIAAGVRLVSLSYSHTHIMIRLTISTLLSSAVFAAVCYPSAKKIFSQRKK